MSPKVPTAETSILHSDRQFNEHFRMGRDVFEKCLEWIAPSMSAQRTISLEKSVLATLWYIGNMETYRSIADRFGLNKGTLKRIVVSVCRILTRRQGEVIRWPTSVAAMDNLAQDFKERCGFPGVVGAVDGTHIEIMAPNYFRDSYFNKNGTASLQLQVVANHNLLFLDVFCGYPGSVHDARVWRNCPLMEKVANELPRQFHLLGDSAYGLQQYMMTPFRNDGHLDRVKKIYNAAHSSTRVEVERAIGLLKGKWRKLKFLEMLVVDDMIDVIMAACTLHNFILLNHGIDEADIGDDSKAGNQNEEQDVADGHPPQLAQDKRMEIAYLLV